jgi:hypothetical protein
VLACLPTLRHDAFDTKGKSVGDKAAVPTGCSTCHPPRFQQHCLQPAALAFKRRHQSGKPAAHHANVCFRLNLAWRVSVIPFHRRFIPACRRLNVLSQFGSPHILHA